jgi:hypothetical protein
MLGPIAKVHMCLPCMPRKSLHNIKQTCKTPCGEYWNEFCIEFTFIVCTHGCEKETFEEEKRKRKLTRQWGLLSMRMSAGEWGLWETPEIRQFGASFPFRGIVGNKELWYPWSLILLAFCVFIEKFISAGLASEIVCSDDANEWSIKKNINLDTVSLNYKLPNALSKVKAMQKFNDSWECRVFLPTFVSSRGLFLYSANYVTSAVESAVIDVVLWLLQWKFICKCWTDDSCKLYQF